LKFQLTLYYDMGKGKSLAKLLNRGSMPASVRLHTQTGYHRP